MNDLDGARKSLSRLRRMKSERSPHVNVFNEMVEGYIRLREEKWLAAIALLEPLLELESVTRETVLELQRLVVDAYQKIGNNDRAIQILQKTITLQERLYEDRLRGQAGRFNLTEELLQLQKKTKRDDALLKAILPPSAYEEVRSSGQCEARYFENVAVFYSDSRRLHRHRRRHTTPSTDGGVGRNVR